MEVLRMLYNDSLGAADMNPPMATFNEMQKTMVLSAFFTFPGQ